MVRGDAMATTTDPPRPPGLFTRAEAGSRQIVLQLGLGFACFIVGSIFSAGATTRIVDRLGPIESELADWALRMVLERTWLFLFLPVCGYGIGRFTELPGSRFALLSGLAGETFALLLLTGMNGLDFVLLDARGVVWRVLSLFVGMMITVLAVSAGRRAALDAQLLGLEEAQKRKAEYAAYLAAAEAPKPGEDPRQG
jgi:Na+/H+ antiporter NhaD/arsenite permease-like protein